MTHEETIKRIQELVPSIMELSFGCEIKRDYDTFPKVRNAKVLDHIGGGSFQVQERIDTSKNEEEYKKDYGHCEITYYEPDSFTILGKPITLAVVLMAIGDKQGRLNVDTAGRILVFNSFGNWGIYGYWNLSKDNFNDQSEETKAFIGGLLINK